LKAGLRPDPLGELTALYRPRSWIKGSLLLREGETEGKIKGGKRKGEREGSVIRKGVRGVRVTKGKIS